MRRGPPPALGQRCCHLDRHRKQRLEVLGTDRVTLDVLATLRRSGPPYQRTAGELMHSSLIRLLRKLLGEFE